MDEALWAATMGGAAALRRDDVGHLAVGARADFAVVDGPRAAHLAYRPGGPLVSRTYRATRCATASREEPEGPTFTMEG